MKEDLTEEEILKSVVIEDKEVLYWKQAKAETEREIKKCNNILKFQEAVLEVCNKKIAEAEKAANERR